MFSSVGRSLAFLSTELPCLVFNRDSSRFFWAKKTCLYNHRPIKPGHCQGKPMVFKNNKTVKVRKPSTDSFFTHSHIVKFRLDNHEPRLRTSNLSRMSSIKCHLCSLFSEVAKKQWSCDSQLPPDPDQEIFRCHVRIRRRQETTHAPTDERGQKDCRVLKHRK